MALLASLLLGLIPLAVVTPLLCYQVFGARATRLDLLASCGLSILSIGWAGYALTLVTFSHLHLWTLATVVALWVWVARRQRAEIVAMLARLTRLGLPRRESLVVVIGLALSVTVSALLFQADAFSNTCLHFAVARAVGLELGAGFLDEIPDWTVIMESAEREGVYATLAPFALVSGYAGLRWFYAVSIGLNGVFALGIARALFPGRQVVRGFVVALFTVYPFLVDMMWTDNNTVTFFAANALLYLTLRGGVRPRHLGVAFAMLVACRHVAVLCALGPFWVHRARSRVTGASDPGLGRELRAYLGAAAVVLLPVALHHTVAFGGPFAFESFLEYDLHPHSFLGLIDFQLAGMLNVPFTDQIVRTPNNPLPLFLFMPAWWVGRMGWILSALATIGAASAIARGRRAWPYLAWVLPYLGLLAISENWMQPEKLNIIAPVVPWALVAAGVGLRRLLSRERALRSAGIMVAALAFVAGGTLASSRVTVPADSRFFDQYPHLAPEEPEYLELERRLIEPGLLPSPEWLRIPRSSDALQDALATLWAPAFEQRTMTPREQFLEVIMPNTFSMFLRQKQDRALPHDASGDGPSVVVEVDLTVPWVTGNDWVRYHGPLARQALPEGSFVLDLREAFDSIAYRRFALPWAPHRTATLTAFRREEVFYLGLSGPNFYERPDDLVELEPPPYPPMTEIEREAPADGRVYLIVPEGRTLELVEFMSLDPSRIYRWQVPEVAKDLELIGPVHWRHD